MTNPETATDENEPVDLDAPGGPALSAVHAVSPFTDSQHASHWPRSTDAPHW